MPLIHFIVKHRIRDRPGVYDWVVTAHVVNLPGGGDPYSSKLACHASPVEIGITVWMPQFSCSNFSFLILLSNFCVMNCVGYTIHKCFALELPGTYMACKLHILLIHVSYMHVSY